MNHKPAFPVVAFLATLLVMIPLSAATAAPNLIGTYSDWSAYSFTENGNKVCYMASQPSKAEGNYTRRGEIFALITHRPAENTKNVFSYITGYTYRPGSDVTVRIGNNRFTLFTQDDTAWAPDADRDNALTNAVRSGSSMVVQGTSSRGTDTTDTFSLKGSAAAYDAISQECGVR